MRIIVILFMLFIVRGAVAQEVETHYDDVLWRDFNAGFVVDIYDDIPSFEVQTLDEDQIDTDIFSGQVLIIEFVASWCPYSSDQMKSINDLKKRWPNDVSVLTISVDDPKDQQAFIERINKDNYSFYYALDPEERIFKLFAQSHSTLPRVVIINKKGKIIGLFDEHTRKTKRIMKRIVRKSVWG